MDQAPKGAELIAQLTEAGCEKRLLQWHISFAALHEQSINTLSFLRRIHTQVEIHTAHRLMTIRGDIVADEHGVANLYARV